MTSLTSFPNFVQLPPEIQILVWECAAHNTLGYQQLKIGMSMSTSSLVTRYIAFPGEVPHGFGGILLKRIRRKGYFNFPADSGARSLMHSCHDSRRILLGELRHGFMHLGPHINRQGDRTYNEEHVAHFYDSALMIIERLLVETKKVQVVTLVDDASDIASGVARSAPAPATSPNGGQISG